MYSPQLEDGFLCLAHELDAAIAAAAFGKVEGILLREIRAGIYGPARLAELQISPAAVAGRWGLSQPSVSNALTRLVKTHVLVRGAKGEYTFNKHYDQWTAANGKPLFNEALRREIRLAPARAMAHKTGVLPPRMVEKALGTTVVATSEPTALPAIDASMAASHAGVTSRGRDSEVTRTLVGEAPKSRGRDAGSHEGVMASHADVAPSGRDFTPESCPAQCKNDDRHKVNVMTAHYVEPARFETGETEKTQDNSRPREGPPRQVSCPDYPDYQTTFLPYHTGAHKIPGDQARLIWGRLWATWKNREFCEGWWSHQEWFSIEVWTKAFAHVRAKFPDGKPINYVITICRDVEANPGKYRKEAPPSPQATVPFRTPSDGLPRLEIDPAEAVRHMEKMQRGIQQRLRREAEERAAKDAPLRRAV